MDVSADVAAIIRQAPEWNFAGDCALLELMKRISQNLQDCGERTNNNLIEFETNVRRVDIALDNATNSLRSLQFGQQFVEYRVEEVDDDDFAMPEEQQPKKGEVPAKSSQELAQEFLQNNLQMFRKNFEAVTIEVPDSDEEEESAANTTTLFRAKNPYDGIPLPYVIGSSEWQQHKYAGLYDSAENSEDEQAEQFSSSSSDEQEVEAAPKVAMETPQLSDSSSMASLVKEAPLPLPSPVPHAAAALPRPIISSTRNPHERDLFAALRASPPSDDPPSTSSSMNSSPAISHRTERGTGVPQRAASISSSSSGQAPVKLFEEVTTVTAVPAATTVPKLDTIPTPAPIKVQAPEQVAPSTHQIKRKPVNLFSDDEFNSFMSEIVDKVQSKSSSQDSAKASPVSSTNLPIPKPAAAPQIKSLNLFDDSPPVSPKAAQVLPNSIFADNLEDDDDFLSSFATKPKTQLAIPKRNTLFDDDDDELDIDDIFKTSSKPKTVDKLLAKTSLFDDDDDEEEERDMFGDKVRKESLELDREKQDRMKEREQRLEQEKKEEQERMREQEQKKEQERLRQEQEKKKEREQQQRLEQEQKDQQEKKEQMKEQERLKQEQKTQQEKKELQEQMREQEIKREQEWLKQEQKQSLEQQQKKEEEQRKKLQEQLKEQEQRKEQEQQEEEQQKLKEQKQLQEQKKLHEKQLKKQQEQKKEQEEKQKLQEKIKEQEQKKQQEQREEQEKEQQKLQQQIKEQEQQEQEQLKKQQEQIKEQQQKKEQEQLEKKEQQKQEQQRPHKSLFDDLDDDDLFGTPKNSKNLPMLQEEPPEDDELPVLLPKSSEVPARLSKVDLFSDDFSDEETRAQPKETLGTTQTPEIKEQLLPSAQQEKSNKDIEQEKLKTAAVFTDLFDDLTESPQESLEQDPIISLVAETDNKQTPTESPKPADIAVAQQLMQNYTSLFSDEPPDDSEFFQSLGSSSLNSLTTSKMFDNESDFFEPSLPDLPSKTTTESVEQSSQDYGGMRLFSDVPPEDVLEEQQSAVASTPVVVAGTKRIHTIFYDDFSETARASRDVVDRRQEVKPTSPVKKLQMPNIKINVQALLPGSGVLPKQVRLEKEQQEGKEWAGKEELEREQREGNLERKEDLEKPEKEKRDQERKEKEWKEQERKDQARKEQRKEEQTSKDQEKKKLKKAGQETKEQEKREQESREQKRKEQQRMEQERKEQQSREQKTKQLENKEQQISEQKRQQISSAGDGDNILQCIGKTRARGPAHRRPSTRRARQASYVKSLEEEQAGETAQQSIQSKTASISSVSIKERLGETSKKQTPIRKAAFLESDDDEDDALFKQLPGITSAAPVSDAKTAPITTSITAPIATSIPTTIPSQIALPPTQPPEDKLQSAAKSKKVSSFLDSDDEDSDFLFSSSKAAPTTSKKASLLEDNGLKSSQFKSVESKTAPRVQQAAGLPKLAKVTSFLDSEEEQDNELFGKPKEAAAAARSLEITKERKPEEQVIKGVVNTNQKQQSIEVRSASNQPAIAQTLPIPKPLEAQPKPKQFVSFLDSEDSEDNEGTSGKLFPPLQSKKPLAEKLNPVKKSSKTIPASNLFEDSDDDDDDLFGHASAGKAKPAKPKAANEREIQPKTTKIKAKLPAKSTQSLFSDDEDDDDLFGGGTKRSTTNTQAKIAPKTKSTTTVKQSAQSLPNTGNSDNPLADLLNP